MIIKYKLEEGAFPPVRSHKEDAGFDLRTPKKFRLWSKGQYTIDTLVHIEIPVGYVGMVKSKSGLMVSNSITTDGTVDAGYTGTVAVRLFNHSSHPKDFEEGDKIAQIVIMPIADIECMEEVETISGGARGSNGFGSTGR